MLARCSMKLSTKDERRIVVVQQKRQWIKADSVVWYALLNVNEKQTSEILAFHVHTLIGPNWSE